MITFIVSFVKMFTEFKKNISNKYRFLKEFLGLSLQYFYNFEFFQFPQMFEKQIIMFQRNIVKVTIFPICAC